MRPVPDADNRRAAVTTDAHAFVWASAGTGKTHTLTLRALYLLLHEAAPELFGADRRARLEAASRMLQRIVLTTFTRKAAAEMRHRLYTYLDAVAFGLDPAAARLPDDPLLDEILGAARRRSGGDAAALARGASALAERAAELQISTLHGFAARLLRRHPLPAGLPAGVHFAREDEDDLLGLEEQLIDRWWQTRALENEQTAAALSEILQVVDVGQLRTWLETALRQRWLAGECGIPRTSAGDAESALDAVRRVSEYLASASTSKMQRVGSEALAAVRQVDSDPEAGWPRLQRLCHTHHSYLFRSGRPKGLRKFLAALDEQAARWFEEPLALEALAGAEWLHGCRAGEWHEFGRLLGDFDEWARRAEVEELGLLTFDEMIRRAVQLLETHPDVRELEGARLHSLLVDEFQDTDRGQLRLIELLLEAHSAPLGFFVGDLKQSIYRFRGADTDEIRRFHRRFGDSSRRPCRDYQLSATFRTAPTVARFANRLFGEHLDLAQPAELLEPVRDETTPTPSWWVLRQVDGADLRRYAARREAAVKTVELLRSCCPSPYAFSEVLVLTRDHRELDALLPELQASGIPTVSSGARTFFSEPEVLDTINLLISLHTPLDPLAAAALLRSPLLQLPDDQIHSLLEHVGTRHLFHGDAAVPEWVPAPVATRIEQLRSLARGRTSMSTDAWLREVSAFIPRTVYVARHDREGRALVRINRILEEFGRFVAGDGAPLSWLIRQRERSASEGRFDSDLGEDVSLSDETLDAVRVMTIHKAKGLEARLVVVFGWSSVLDATHGSRSARSSAVESRGPKGDPVRGFNLPWGPARVISPGYTEACALEEEGERREAARLAYVAATRARDELVLLNPVWSGWRCSEAVTLLLQQDPPPDWIRLDTARGLPGSLEPAEGGLPDLQGPRYRDRWNALYRAQDMPPEGLSHPSADAPPGDEAAAAFGLQVGRLVHAYLERHLLEGLDDRALDAAAAGIEGLAAGVRSRSREVLARFFDGGLTDRTGRPYCDRAAAARVLGREVPLLLTADGRRWSAAIDLVLEEEGRVVAVDYKTTPPLDPLPAAYRSQQRIYLEGLRRVFSGRPVDFEFWWLGTGDRVDDAAPPRQTELPFG